MHWIRIPDALHIPYRYPRWQLNYISFAVGASGMSKAIVVLSEQSVELNKKTKTIQCNERRKSVQPKRLPPPQRITGNQNQNTILLRTTHFVVISFISSYLASIAC